MHNIVPTEVVLSTELIPKLMLFLWVVVVHELLILLTRQDFESLPPLLRLLLRVNPLDFILIPFNAVLRLVVLINDILKVSKSMSLNIVGCPIIGFNKLSIN